MNEQHTLSITHSKAHGLFARFCFFTSRSRLLLKGCTPADWSDWNSMPRVVLENINQLASKETIE